MRKDSNTITRNAMLTWFLFIPIVILNGTVREKVYKPLVGELLAHQISTGIASIAFFILSYILLKKFISAAPTNKLLFIGGMWVLMTVSFELILGRFILGNSWEKLFYDYNILKGRLWTLLLLSIFMTPVLLKQFIRQRKPIKHETAVYS